MLLSSQDTSDLIGKDLTGFDEKRKVTLKRQAKRPVTFISLSPTKHSVSRFPELFREGRGQATGSHASGSGATFSRAPACGPGKGPISDVT